MSPAAARIRLADLPGEGRTTTTLVASLAARLSALHWVSGNAAVGSLVQGFSVLGRTVGRTAEGAGLRRALESGRAGMNGNAIWQALHLEEWTAGLPASPVLDHLRNDLALLLAPDLADAIELLPVPGQAAGDGTPDDGHPAAFVDCALGLWAFSRELVRCVEALAAPTLPVSGGVVAPDDADPPPPGALLR